jgi:hypothetical protein
MSSTDQIIKRALDNTTLNTLDSAIGMISALKVDYADRVNEYQAGADDALSEMIRRLHLLQLKLREGNSEL